MKIHQTQRLASVGRAIIGLWWGENTISTIQELCAMHGLNSGFCQSLHSLNKCHTK